MTVVPRACLTMPTGAPLVRVVFNRDEQRSRRLASPPRVVRVRGRRALMPIDPQGGGTWIAATDAGLVLALLNRTPVRRTGATGAGSGPGQGSARPSRGRLIPQLVGCATVDMVAQGMRQLDTSGMAPFRLVCVDGARSVDAWWDGQRLTLRMKESTRPELRTSSSLGDGRVRPPRATLFRACLGAVPINAAEQDAFHRHRWPARPEVSVLMDRADARTVSIVTIEIHERRIVMTYDPVWPSGHSAARSTYSIG